MAWLLLLIEMRVEIEAMTNTTTAKEGDGGELPGYGSCAHCGEPTDTRTAVESDGLRFCCTGCSAVYEILNSLGLDDYYKIRAAQNITGTAPARDPASGEDYSYLDQKSFIDIYTTEEKPLTMSFYVEGIECAACLWLIAKSVRFACSRSGLNRLSGFTGTDFT